MVTKAFGAHAADTPLKPIDIERRAPDRHDVEIDIAYCGVCHSDLHQVRSEWDGTLYPYVPGHEIVGHVSAVGSEVSRFKVGDVVGVGCMVDSCQHCEACDAGLEQYCKNGFTGTYNGKTDDAPGHTLGGYSQKIVVNDKFVLRIAHPEEKLAAVAPLLCAGITLYSPLKHWGAGPGKKVGIVGTAASAIWASRSPTRSVRTSSPSPPPRASAAMRWRSVPTRSSSRRMPTR